MAKSLNDLNASAPGAGGDDERVVMPWYPSGESVNSKALPPGGLGGVIEAQAAPFKPKLNKFRGVDGTKDEDKRDFLDKMTENMKKHTAKMEAARKDQLNAELGLGNPDAIMERRLKDAQFLRDCLAERLRLADVRIDSEAIADYIKCGPTADSGVHRNVAKNRI